MAEREDIRKRIRRVQPDPKIRAASDAIEKALVQSGSGEMVILTEDMTKGEEEMAFLERYLKDGYPFDTAERKAKESAALMRRVFCY